MIIAINVLHNIIVHQVGHLPRVVPGCTVSKTQKCIVLLTTTKTFTYLLKLGIMSTSTGKTNYPTGKLSPKITDTFWFYSQ